MSLRRLETGSHASNIAEFYADTPVERFEAGYPSNGGRLPRAGWYVRPYCHPMCCRPDGPFPTRAAAARWAQAMARAMKGRRPRAEQRIGREADALFRLAGGKRQFFSSLGAYHLRMATLRPWRGLPFEEANVLWRLEAEGDNEHA
jgi:hypothetical protein